MAAPHMRFPFAPPPPMVYYDLEELYGKTDEKEGKKDKDYIDDRIKDPSDEDDKAEHWSVSF